MCDMTAMTTTGINAMEIFFKLDDLLNLKLNQMCAVC